MSDMLLFVSSDFWGFHLGLAGALACITATILLHIGRDNKSQRISPPCEIVIEQAEHTNRKNGHENAGFLSRAAAFSPLILPRKSLPLCYTSWDQTAAALPHLIQTGALRATLDSMPVLDACSKEDLPDQYLQRAATILGILAHAYVRLEGETSLTIKYNNHEELLPKGLYAPWTQVCQRLGRMDSNPSLSYIDLVVYNFTATCSPDSDLSLERLGLLIPTVNNKEERTFYGTMVEINSKVIPIFHQIIETQRFVLMEDAAMVKHSLQAMIPLLREITKTFHKISMNEASGSYVDPVVWTTTVANLAIPWLKGVTGAAGTAHPFFHMMDEFIGRKTYESKIGKEAIAVRSTYPVHWQRFLYALSQVSVRRFIDQLGPKDKRDLSNLWTTLESEYGGNWGLLGIHRRKVYGFLSVSFRLGRNSTINGLGRSTRRAKWTEADHELEEARRERKPDDLPKHNVCCSHQLQEALHFSDIIQHNTAARGYWFASGDDVYDASGFMEKHPGGKTVIALCSGQDATTDLAAVAHLSEPKIQAVLKRYRIGKVRRAIFESPSLQILYEEAVWLGQKVAETENIYRTTLSSLVNAKLTVLDKPNEITPHKLHHLRKTREKMREGHCIALADQVDVILALLEGMKIDLDAGRARAALAKVRQRTSIDIRNIGISNRAKALAWFEPDLQRLGAMNGHAVATLKTLESLPFHVKCVDISSADAVVARITAIADNMLHLGA